MLTQNLSEDSQVILLLCSSLAIHNNISKNTSKDDKESQLNHLTLKQWNELARKIAKSELKRPRALLETTATDLQQELGINSQEIEQIHKLLQGSGHLALELERLERLGIWVTTRAESSYPQRLKTILKDATPPVLYGAGEQSWLEENKGVAIVGSRDISEAGAEFTQQLAEKCVEGGFKIVSGGARGVDQLAQDAAIAKGGRTVAILADSMVARLRKREIREALTNNQLLLLSPHHPEASFKVWGAMDRNKLIYALADYAVVVAATLGEGGTWNGATQNLKAKWVPLFVRTDSVEDVAGNKELIQMGGLPLDKILLQTPDLQIGEWLELQSAKLKEAEPETPKAIELASPTKSKSSKKKKGKAENDSAQEMQLPLFDM